MVTNAEAFQLECEEVKAAQQSEDSVPADFCEPDPFALIRRSGATQDRGYDDHARCEFEIARALEQQAIDQADEWDRLEARAGEYEHDDRGSLFPRSAAPEEYREPEHGIAWRDIA